MLGMEDRRDGAEMNGKERRSAILVKLKPAARHGTPWRRSKILHRCDL